MYWLFVVKPENRQASTLHKRLRPVKPEAVRAATGGSLEQRASQLSSVNLLNRLLQRASGLSGPLERLVTQSGLRITVGMLVMACGLSGVVALLVVQRITYSAWLGLMIAPFAAFVPFAIVRYMRARRLLKFEEQFPEAIELLARTLRAGHAFPTGLSLVAEEMEEPIGPEFKLLFDRQNFGMPMPDALRGLAERIPVLDARFFVTAVLTQRETGGNLSEILQNLASVIRDRFKIKRQVRVVTAHGRITGWILCALPPALACIITLISPAHLQTLVGDPLGHQMIGGALFLQVSGTLIMRKLVNVPY
jgi:tight adherence protein B